MRSIRTRRRHITAIKRPTVGGLRTRGRTGGGAAEHARVQKLMADPLWNMMAGPLSVLPQPSQDKIKDILYRGAWDWLSDH